ncbi:heme lyase CcmF/NrfE family subunit [bacterium]|nr:heme lyase CcmF/NrfE family subunit [bacterium]
MRLMIYNVAYLVLIAAAVIAAFGVFAGYWGGVKRLARFSHASFNAVYAVGGMVFFATCVLWYALLNDRFEVTYVWNHSERALPTFYKFSALWGGQAGSLLFWTLIISCFSVAVAKLHRNKQQSLMPFVNATILSTSLFFLVLLIFAANPFKLNSAMPPDGQGLNPLLQNYWMVIHPVMLYLGWIGLTVPFAFAVGALMSRRLGNEWVRIVRRWTLIPWMFLSVGILMGSQWAYMELGWGGYWAWDPVENASFIPWLTATAFLHSIIIQEQRGILKVWNVVLIFSTYFLVILGTFITRSGLIESVHSFALSDVGPFFLGFMVILLFGFIWLLFNRLPLLKDEQPIDSYASREAAFLGNNWLFAGIAFATLWGTFFPMFSELLVQDRISVAAPFFNRVNGPLFLILFLLMGIGPLLGWRRTSMEAMRRQFTWPLVFAVLSGIAAAVYNSQIFSVIGMTICAFVTGAIVQEFVRGTIARRVATNENVIVALGSLMRRNGRRYGGYTVHLGIVMMGVAIIGNEFYLTSTNVTLGQNESVNLTGYEITYTGLDTDRGSNVTSITANLDVRHIATGRFVGTLVPHRNIYDKNPDMPTSEVGLHMNLLRDVYVVLNGWEDRGATATFSVYINPLTIWLWLGGIVLIIGTLISAWPHPSRRLATAPEPAAYARA